MFLGAATAAVASNSSSQNGDEVLRSNCGQLCTSNQDCRDGKCPVCSSKDNVCSEYPVYVFDLFLPVEKNCVSLVFLSSLFD